MSANEGQERKRTAGDDEWESMWGDVRDSARSSMSVLMVAGPMILCLAGCLVLWNSTGNDIWIGYIWICIFMMLFYGVYVRWNNMTGLFDSRTGFAKKKRSEREEKSSDGNNDSLTRYSLTLIIAPLVLLVIVSVLRFFDNVIFDYVNSWLIIGYAAYIALFILSTLKQEVSHIVVDRDRRIDELTRQMAIIDRDNRIAGKMHDSVTGDLSYIAFVAQNNTSKENDGKNKDWRSVNQVALKALDDMHELIDLLKHNKTSKSDITANNENDHFFTFIRAIANTMDVGDGRMNDLGIRGDSTVNGSCSLLFDDGNRNMKEVISFVKEVYNNLMKHADPDFPYSIFISVEQNEVIVSQQNTCLKHERLPSSERGMGLHRSMIEMLGGELNANAEDGEWTLHARIPLTATVSANGR